MFFIIKNIEDKRWRFVAEMDIYVVNIQCYSYKNMFGALSQRTKQ